MNRISDEKYKDAKGCLKRFAYNKLNILTIRFDLVGITGINYDNELIRTNKINDIVANSVIRLEENKALNQSIREYKAVELAKKLVNDEDSLYILEHLYDKQDMRRWEIINNVMSESTFRRKHKKLVLTVYDILKKDL